MDDGIGKHLAATDLTTLAFFSVTHSRNGEMDESQTGYRRIVAALGQRLIREAQERGTRVEIVYSSFGVDRNRAFFADSAAQDRWIEVLVEFTAARGFDGINVDVERLPADLLGRYGDFVERLRDVLRERLPDAQVSAATQANEMGAAMAVAAARAGADRIFLMGYDYRWSGSEPGASAPLDRIDGGFKDLAWSLDLYESLGVPVDRTILGLPLYGMTWPVAGPDFGAPAVGRGATWVPRRNLRVFDNPSFAPAYDPIESVEFYAVAGGSPETPWNAVYYDSPRSLAPKLALADERGLAGAGFWAIGYERGLPGYSDLIKTFRSGRLEGGAPP
jgi:spore germination protein YaaH